MIQEAIETNKKEKLKLLHEKDKLNPASVNLRVKRYISKNKDAINEKRRLKREEMNKKKLENSLLPSAKNKNVKSKEDKPLKEDNSSKNNITYVDDLTVRFDQNT